MTCCTAPSRRCGPAPRSSSLAGDPATDADLADLEQQLAGRAVDVARIEDGGEVAPLLAPLVATVRGQQLARALARARGLDPDSPPGLSKVTRTR